MKKYSILTVVLLVFVMLLSVSTVQAEVRTYRVQSGDSLWNISQRFEVPVNQIMQRNNIVNPTNLYVGQGLVITRTNNKITITFGNNTNTNNTTRYTVKTGDTLWKIANKFGTTMEKLVSLNSNIDSNYNLYIGQKLVISSQNNQPEPTNSYYYVKPGDILWNIAQKFNTTVAKLVELNDIQNAYDLYVGRRLIVEKNTGNQNYPEYPQYPEYPDYNPGGNNSAPEYKPYTFYKVKAGDLFWNIADHFGVRVSELINENNITDINQIQADSIIVIPLENSAKIAKIRRQNKELNNYYQVKQNETLSEIANYFNIPEKVISLINDLDNEATLYRGKKLLMPISLAFTKAHQIYTVRQNNEPLHKIASDRSLSMQAILRANYMNDLNAKFKAGTKLILPQDEDSKTRWTFYKDGKPVNSFFSQ